MMFFTSINIVLSNRHFTLELEGRRDQGVLMDEQTYIMSYMAMDDVSWSTEFCGKPASKRWVSRKTR